MQLPSSKFMTEVSLKSSLLLLAVTLGALELFIPRIPFFPWLKPGIANIVTVIVILKYGYRESLLFLLLRIWIVSFYFGFSFFTSSLALSGGILAITVMAITSKLFISKKIIGFVGLSVLGAVSHNFGQLIGVYFLISKNDILFQQVPFMLIISAISGSFVGYLASLLFKAVQRIALDERPLLNFDTEYADTASPFQSFLIIFLILFCFLLVFVNNLLAIGIITGIVLFSVQVMYKFNPVLIFKPLIRFWIIFLSIILLNIFNSYGRVIPEFPFLTYESFYRTLSTVLKVYAWLQLTFVFTKYNLHKVILFTLMRTFPENTSTLMAAVEAVELFPSVVQKFQKRSFFYFKQLVKEPEKMLAALLEDIINLGKTIDVPR